MNVQQPGFLAGAVLGGAGVGAIAGLVPLFLGVRRGKTGFAVGGFLACVAGGLVAGIVGAPLLMGIFSFVITRKAEAVDGQTQKIGGSSKGSTAVAWYLVIAFFGLTIFLTGFWSAFMAVSLQKSFINVLFPSGAVYGLTMGIFFTAVLPFMFRAGTEPHGRSWTAKASWLESIERPPSCDTGVSRRATDRSFMSPKDFCGSRPCASSSTWARTRPW